MSQSEEERQRIEVLKQIGADTSNLELLNSELANRLGRQEDAHSRVDTKIAFLLGLIATATQFLATRHPQPVLGALAFTGYAAAFGLGVPALVIRPYPEIEPRALLEYARTSKTETLLALCAVRVSNYEKNDSKHQQKTVWWWRSFIATIIALVLSVLAIVDAGSHDSAVGRQRPAPGATPSANSATTRGSAPAAPSCTDQHR